MNDFDDLLKENMRRAIAEELAVHQDQPGEIVKTTIVLPKALRTAAALSTTIDDVSVSAVVRASLSLYVQNPDFRELILVILRRGG